MRLGRIASPDGVAFVSIEGEGDSQTAKEIAEHPFGTPTFTGRSWPLADVRLLAPILASKVIAIGKNYAAHAAEMGGDAPKDPVIFIKPNTSIVGPGAAIVLPPSSNEVHYEGELAIVIGRPCKDVPASKAYEVVLGYTVANDVSVRDFQRTRHGGQWFKGKNFDTHCPLGPWIVTADEIPDPHALAISSRINGETKQSSNTRHMVFGVSRIIAELSAGMSLEAGDIILTGTPSGVGFARTPPEFLRVGDVMEMEIEGIGVLRNTVAEYRP